MTASTEPELRGRAALIAAASERLLVATSDGLVTVGGITGLAGRDVTDLAVGPGRDRIAALIDGTEIHRRDAAGDWSRVAAVGDGPHRVIVWHGDDLLVGGADAHLWRVTVAGDAHRIDTFDHAPTRPEWHTPWGGPPDVYSMASDGTDAFVNVHVGGILRSEDLRSWTPTIDLHLDVHDVTIGGDGTLWAATGMRGLARSTDRGRSWTHVTAGLHADYARAVAAVNGDVLVSVSSGPFARDGALYRLDGGTLRPLTQLPAIDGSVDRGRLVAVDRVVAVALPGGDVLVSSDAGDTWHQVGSVRSTIRAIALLTPATA